MKYSSILQNLHFRNLAAVIRKPHTSSEWRGKYSQVPFWKLLKGVENAKTPQIFATNRAEFVGRFCELLAKLASADLHLQYTTEDLAWFIEMMDNEHALPIASLLLAYASAPETQS